MVRTKADAMTARVSGAKAPRKIQATTCTTTKKASSSYSGGNPYCPRETPKWQKEITKFFQSKSENCTMEADATKLNDEQNPGGDVDSVGDEASNDKKSDEGDVSSKAA